jgi:hypothetical protein
LKFFIRSERGAVSVYLIIITTVMFIFNAVLIDFARIMAAERQTDDAVRAGVRSILSAYDIELQRYGLYAVGISEEDAKEMFNHVVNKNLSLNLSPSFFKLIDTRLDEQTVDLQFDHQLSHQEIIEEQILQEMKYRAPTEILLEVVDKLSPIEQKMKKASEEVKESRHEIHKYEEFRQEMKKIKVEMRELIGLQGDIQRINNIVSLYEANMEDESLEEEKREAERKSNRENNLSIINEAVRDANRIISLENTLEENLLAATTVSKNLKEDISKTATGSGDTDCSIPNRKEHDLEFDGIKSVDLPSYTTINKSILALKSDLQTKAISSENLATQVSFIILAHSEYFDQVIVQDERVKKLVDKIDLIEDQVEIIEKCFRKHREETDQELDEAMQDLEDNMQVQDDYKKLKKFYEKYTHSKSRGERSKDISNDAADLGEEAIGLMDGVFGRVSGMMVNLRDEAYINEYALTKLNYLTFQEGKAFDPAQLEEHQLKQQEIEYVLHGMHLPKVNIAAVLTEIFTLRLAIRTIEGLEKYRYLGVPKLIVISAVTHGIIKANQDLTALKAGHEVVLTKYAPKIKLNYLNYVRLFFLTHSDNKIDKLPRIQSLIELNTNKDLAQKHTYIRASASTSVRLWFIPGIMKALHRIDVLDGDVEGNRYQIVKVAAMSY